MNSDPAPKLDYASVPIARSAAIPVRALVLPRDDRERQRVATILGIMSILGTLAFADSSNWLRSSNDGYLLDQLTAVTLIVIVIPLFGAWMLSLFLGLLSIWHWIVLSARRVRVQLIVFVALWLGVTVWHARCPHGHFIAIGPMTFGTQGERNCNQKKQYVPIWLPTTSDGK